MASSDIANALRAAVSSARLELEVAMRMSCVLVLCCLAIASVFADETNLTLTVDGDTYSNVTFGTVTPSSVSIRHSTGIARVPLAKLPPELQKRFGYDPVRVKEQQNLEQKRRDEERQLRANRKAEEEAKADDDRKNLTGESITSVPLVGDETTTVKILADPKVFLNKKIIICGGLVLPEGYLGSGFFSNFSNAADTHYAWAFHSVNAKAEQIHGTFAAYCDRRVGKPLSDWVVAVQEKGDFYRLVRMKVMVTERCFEDGQFRKQMEIIDWQKLKDDRTGWSGWQVHPSND